MADTNNTETTGTASQGSLGSKKSANDDQGKEESYGAEAEAEAEAEEEGEGEDKKEEEQPKSIPDNFFYQLEENLSKPIMSEGCELPENLLSLWHSFGYNCRQRNNLHALDEGRLVFAAGAYLQFLDVNSMHSTFIRNTGGGSVGPIAIHPHGRLFAVGEKCHKNPPINVFVIANCRLYRILKGGTTRAYNALAFNASGELLASQGSEPDFMLTVWNWKQETLILRCKAFGQEVHHVSFNKDLQGWLTTSGAGHIKFWNMALTFTGLKLHGFVGRFGRTALSDIEGFVEFPDGKVLSGSEWGNMLLWDENLIKLQVCRKDGKPCHQGQINQMMIIEGEIITAGTDGYVRCWNWESIDQAEAAEEGGMVEARPMSEVLIGPNVLLYYLTKPPKAERYEGDEGLREVELLPDVLRSGQRASGVVEDLPPELHQQGSLTSGHPMETIRSAGSIEVTVDASKHVWYCQDGNGAIWKADLSFLSAARAPKQLVEYHAGKIVGCAVSPMSHLVMTLGEDGFVRLHDFLLKKTLATLHFKAAGVCLIWVPLSIDRKCASVLAGFADGGIRLVSINADTTVQFGVNKEDCCLKLVRSMKPHEKAVTSVAFDVTGEHLATCSEDKTIFFFYVMPNSYYPMCFVPLDYLPRQIIFSMDTVTFQNLMVVCDDGHIIEMISPTTYEMRKELQKKHDSRETLRYEGCRTRQFQFQSCRSQMEHDEELEATRREEDEKQRKLDEEDDRRIREGIETPSQQNVRKENERLLFKAQKEREEAEQAKLPKWEPYIPPVPSPILQALYFEPNARFWLSMANYDAGYLYECELPRYYAHVLDAASAVSVPPSPTSPKPRPGPNRTEAEATSSRPQSGKVSGSRPPSAKPSSSRTGAGAKSTVSTTSSVYPTPESSRVTVSGVTRAVRVEGLDDVAINVIRFNSEGTCVFFGLQDGRIRLQFLETEFDLASPNFYWMIPAHDSAHGAITGMELSHDEAFLITVGEDGNFFVFSLMPLHQLKEEVKELKAKIPTADPEQRLGVDLEPGQYTIEQAKQKTDYDRMMREAEKLKSEKRIAIAQLRTRFRKLLMENLQMPSQHRLTKDEFLMDEGRLREMREETEDKLKELRCQLAWHCEKARLCYQKMHDRYRKYLTQDRFAVRAFNTDHVIWSYRTLDQPVEGDYEADTEEDEEERSSKSREQSAASPEQSVDMGELFSSADVWDGVSQRTKYLLQQLQYKRKKRAKRARQWKQFLETKPHDDYADPDDLRAIAEAERTIGDFKLKASEDYKVPDTYRLTLGAARDRLKTCEAHLLGLQNRFNQRLLALRDEKAEIVQDINGMVERLKVISEDISVDQFHPVPGLLSLTADEQPEKHFSFSKTDLMALKARLEEEERRRTDSEQGALLPTAIAQPKKSTPQAPQSTKGRKSSDVQRIARPKLSRAFSIVNRPRGPSSSITRHSSSTISVSAKQSGQSPGLQEAEPAAETDDKSALREEYAAIRNIHLIYEQGLLHESIKKKKTLFDIEHRLLRHTKFRLDVLTKMGDLRTVTLTEEKLLMKECESVENAIRSRISQNSEQQTDMAQKIKQYKDGADRQTRELEKCTRREKALYQQLDGIIGEKNAFRDYLVKVFKKKIKRKVKKEGEGGEETESSSESSDEDEEEEEEEDDEDATYFDLNVCPQACNKEIYDEVVQLREARLDLDDQVMELKRQRDFFNKEIENVRKKKVAVDATLDKANKELAAFQTEKQKRVNSLDVLTLLRLHQLQCLRRHDMPPDVDELLNINEDDVIRLQARIRELKVEIKEQKKFMLASRKRHVHLHYERANFQERLAETEEACDDAMRKKLGRIVDMEVLDCVVCDPDLEEVRFRVSKNRRLCDEEMREAERQHKELLQERDDLMLRLDSEFCYVQASLLQQQFNYEKSLNSMFATSRMRYEEAEGYKLPKDMEELISVIAQQRVAMQALGREIDYLTKGPKPVIKTYHRTNNSSI